MSSITSPTTLLTTSGSVDIALNGNNFTGTIYKWKGHTQYVVVGIAISRQNKAVNQEALVCVSNEWSRSRSRPYLYYLHRERDSQTDSNLIRPCMPKAPFSSHCTCIKVGSPFFFSKDVYIPILFLEEKKQEPTTIFMVGYVLYPDTTEWSRTHLFSQNWETGNSKYIHASTAKIKKLQLSEFEFLSF